MKHHFKYKIIFFNLLIFVFTIFFGGCNDKHELDEILVAVGIGIDKIPGDEPIRVTIQIANPTSVNSGSNTSESRGNYVLEVSTGKSVFDAIQNFSKINSLIVDFSHVSIIILSKELCEYGVSEILDYFVRDRQFRNTDWLLVAEKSATEILESNIPSEESISIGIHNMMTQFKKDPYLLPVTINEFIIKSESESKSSYIPEIILEKSKDGSSRKIKIENTAILKNNKLVGILTNEETKSLLWLSDTQKGHMTIFPFTSGEYNQSVTVELDKKSSKIIPHITKDGVHFEIKLIGNASIKEIKNIKFNPEMIKKIQRNTEKQLKNQITKLINISQKSLNTDFIGFSNQIYNNNPKTWFHLKHKWNEIFPNVTYKINIKITIINIGIINNSVITNDLEDRSK